jgi:putative two-component system response regulator
MPDAHERSEKRTVLIVDDDPMNVELLHELLREKYKVRLAGNGAQALKAARQQPQPHAILLDIMMPGMDGLRFARA